MNNPHISTIFFYPASELREYFDQSMMNKPVTYLHPFEEFIPGVGRQLTQDGCELMEMIKRNTEGTGK